MSAEAKQEIREEIRRLLARYAEAEGYDGYPAHFYVTSEIALEQGGYTRLDLASEGASMHVSKGLLYCALTDPGWHGERD